MDKISGLPDDVLLKILSLVPTKVAVSTSIWSKRWEFLWMWLPNLKYKIDNYVPFIHLKPPLLDFMDKKLPLHKAPIIESLHLRFAFNPHVMNRDVKRWVEIAVSRHVRELKIYYHMKCGNIFPSNMFTCQSLVFLKLKYISLMDAPSMVCLPSLKTLHLKCVKFGDEKTLQRLLSICPVLEDLLVYCTDMDVLKVLAISVPSLQSLTLYIPDDWTLEGYKIDTPSLRYFKLEDWKEEHHYSLIMNMPKLKEAYLDLRYSNLMTVIGSIKSVKHLTICSQYHLYGDGFVLNELEHLNLCLCDKDSSNLLGQLLKHSPKLRELDISIMKDHEDNEISGMVGWDQPSHVPRCLLSSLQIFNWSRPFDRPRDIDIAVYINKNACHLNKAKSN